ncbi:alpha/beta-hydrolase [Sparassis crispa]|uniref:Alpha/beta-hydrolase n=1 Tax=Sparassis crispa TaxID=139825 RepID=A0A401GKM7_9APHY|nr:alpha/beta-hydrolase [Sparassis crispa]GBE82694.1 alpha/beta-hydrolase [Sparassis crispa]
MPPFAYRNQPARTSYIVYTVSTMLLVRLPYWTFTNLLPSWRPCPAWSLCQTLVIKVGRVIVDMLYATRPPAVESLEKIARDAKKRGFVWVEPAPEPLVGDLREMAEVNGVKAARTGGFWYGARDADGNVGQKAASGEKVVYHMHGGGYVMGSANPSAQMVTTCLSGFLVHFPTERIFAIEYRLCSAPPFESANPFPAALLDALAGYRYLLDLGFAPQDIIISGDSAGGALAFALARYLVAAALPTLPAPGGLLMLSPTVDWGDTHTGPDSSMVRNAGTDCVGAIFESGYTKAGLVGRLPASIAATSAWISPGSLKAEVVPGMFASMPQTCIVTGEVEMTLDPMRTLRDRMRADIGEERVVYIEGPGMTHDYLTAAWCEPERTDTLREIAAWVKKL